MYKKRDTRAKLLFFQPNPIASLPSSLLSRSLLLKLPNIYDQRNGLGSISLSVRLYVRRIKVFLISIFVFVVVIVLFLLVM